MIFPSGSVQRTCRGREDRSCLQRDGHGFVPAQVLTSNFGHVLFHGASVTIIMWKSIEPLRWHRLQSGLRYIPYQYMAVRHNFLQNCYTSGGRHDFSMHRLLQTGFYKLDSY